MSADLAVVILTLNEERTASWPLPTKLARGGPAGGGGLFFHRWYGGAGPGTGGRVGAARLGQSFCPGELGAGQRAIDTQWMMRLDAGEVVTLEPAAALSSGLSDPESPSRC
jgi:hypothetical protein